MWLLTLLAFSAAPAAASSRFLLATPAGPNTFTYTTGGGATSAVAALTAPALQSVLNTPAAVSITLFAGAWCTPIRRSVMFLAVSPLSLVAPLPTFAPLAHHCPTAALPLPSCPACLHCSIFLTCLTLVVRPIRLTCSGSRLVLAAPLIINSTTSVSLNCSTLASPPACVLDGAGKTQIVIVNNEPAVQFTGLQFTGGNIAKANLTTAFLHQGGSAINVRASTECGLIPSPNRSRSRPACLTTTPWQTADLARSAAKALRWAVLVRAKDYPFGVQDVGQALAPVTL